MSDQLPIRAMKRDWEDTPGMRFEGDLMGMWAAASAKEPDYRTDAEKALLETFFAAWNGLRELGWREAIYCPKDGSYFLVVEPGSTGIFPCRYRGTWPDGGWWTNHAGDEWPSRPCLWKPMPPDPKKDPAPEKGPGAG